MRHAPLVVVLLFSIGIASGAVVTWTGATNGQWSIGTNWSGGVAPSPGDDLVFPATGVTTQSTTNDFPANTLFNSITIDGSDGSGPVLAGNAIRLGAGGITFKNPAPSFLDVALDVTLPITLAAPQTWNLDDTNGNAAAGLPIDGPVNLNGMALTLQYNSHARPFWGGPISGAGSITLASPANSDGIIYNAVSTTAAPMTIPGGFQEFAGSYPGPITVNGGGGTELILENAATVGAINMQQGFLLPGPNPGGSANSGSVAFSSASTLILGVSGTTAGNFSQLNVTGTVTLGNAALIVSSGAAIPAGAALTIINNDGSDAVVGTFAFLPEGALFVSSPPAAQVFKITYAGGDGNDVVITNVGSLTTTTTLTPSENPHEFGIGTLNLTATVTSPSGIPQGAVKFFDGTKFLASVELDATGHAVATNVFLLPGTHTLTAQYLGLPDSVEPVGASTSAAITEVVLPGPARLPMLDWRVMILLAIALAATGAIVSGRG